MEGHIALWALIALSGLLVLKAGIADPRTTLLRNSSTCDHVAAAANQVSVTFGDGLRLCAMSPVPEEIQPGQKLTTTLYWTAEKPVERRLVSFVHLLGTQFNPKDNTPLWGQTDTEVPGGLTVERWQPGKLYRDQYTFQVAETTPPGPYRLEIGWYDKETGDRLKPVIEPATSNLAVGDPSALLTGQLKIP